MQYWVQNFTNRRRNHNSSNGIDIPKFSPKKGSDAPQFFGDAEDIVLCQGQIHIPANLKGDWQDAVLFMSRSELSELIDFIVEDKEIFKEVCKKVFARAESIVKGA